MSSVQSVWNILMLAEERDNLHAMDSMLSVRFVVKPGSLTIKHVLHVGMLFFEHYLVT